MEPFEVSFEESELFPELAFDDDQDVSVSPESPELSKFEDESFSEVFPETLQVELWPSEEEWVCSLEPDWFSLWETDSESDPSDLCDATTASKRKDKRIKERSLFI